MKNKKTTTTGNTIDMPEVKDIPGQENIKPPRMGEMRDTTISSAGEEGEGIVDDLNTEDELDEKIATDADVTDQEIKLLDQTDRPVTEETKDLQKLALDRMDEDDPLNEESNPLDMGEDLDIPGSELDDDNEALGEEDEENNSYSQRD
ncbi:MAG TPA: hypothetical protein VF487_12125 [Chitinophagaceae bacterium]